MRKEFAVFLVFSVFSLLVPFLSYNFNSNLARLFLVTFFFIPILWTIRFSLRQSDLFLHETKIAGAVACSVAPVFIFLSRNIPNLYSFLNSVEITQTSLIAESYAQQGAIDLVADTHAPFFQTPYLMHALSSISGLPVTVCAGGFLVFYFVFISLVGIYVAKVLSTFVDGKIAFLPYLASFSLISASTLMTTTIPYRYTGSLLLPLLGFFLLSKVVKSNASLIVLFFLVVGITFGDPVSSILMMPLFILYHIFDRHKKHGKYKSALPLSFLIIPALYLLYVGILYVYTWRSYFVNAWAGLSSFYTELFSGNFAERVLPWQRTIGISKIDNNVVTLAFLSLLLLAFSLCLLYFFFLWNTRKQRTLKKESPFVRAVFVYVFLFLIAISVVYVGASVRPETSISDTRTTLIGYLALFLIFAFASKTLLSKFGHKKIVIVFIILLLLFSSMRVFYRAYPKSALDPILVVENSQLDPVSVDYSQQFMFSYYSSGSIICDYKTGWGELRSIVKTPDTFAELGVLTSAITADIIIIDINGLKYPSVYVPSDVYILAYQVGINRNVIYNNGPILAFEK